MEENIKVYLNKRIAELEKDKNDLQEELLKNDGKYIENNSQDISKNEALGYDEEMKKIEAELETANDEKATLEGWIEKKQSSENEINGVLEREASLLKDKSQCEEEITKVKSKLNGYSEEKPKELVEYENDLEKIKAELSKVNEIKEKYNDEIKETNSQMESYAIKHGIEIKKDDEKLKQNTGTEPIQQEAKSGKENADDVFARITKIFEDKPIDVKANEQNETLSNGAKEETIHTNQGPVRTVSYVQREPTADEIEKYLRSKVRPEFENNDRLVEDRATDKNNDETDLRNVMMDPQVQKEALEDFQKALVDQNKKNEWWRKPLRAIKNFISKIKGKFTKQKGNKNKEENKVSDQAKAKYEKDDPKQKFRDEISVQMQRGQEQIGEITKNNQEQQETESTVQKDGEQQEP